MSKDDNKVRRAKGEKKVLTRAQAERALSRGVTPEQFTGHHNYHVRYKAWRKMGMPLPEKIDEQNKFLATLQGKEVPKDASLVPAFMDALRHKFLGEDLPAEETAG